MGVAIGHVDDRAMGLVTLVGLVTIALSVSRITWSQALYRLCKPVPGVFERRTPCRETDRPGEQVEGAAHHAVARRVDLPPVAAP
ncbi:MAG: hypothetical protein MUF73_04425 [Rhodobacteraceae bacterium]|nr:hypothetical protein [Paracoccaceae bacterium]